MGFEYRYESDIRFHWIGNEESAYRAAFRRIESVIEDDNLKRVQQAPGQNEIDEQEKLVFISCLHLLTVLG